MTSRVTGRGRDRSILVASSLCAATERLAHHFAFRGYHVDVVHDSLECARKVRAGPPDALIIDWDLQWGEDEGVLSALYECNPMKRVPIILLTETGLMELDIFAPGVKCLRWPKTAELIFETVEAALASIRRSKPKAWH